MKANRGTRWARAGYTAVRLYAVGRNQSRRFGQRVDTALGDLLFALTTDAEKSVITEACYATTGHTQGDGRQTLYDWEQRWYADALPEPPARILVAGAGWGREMGALRDQGYTVVGFDPVEPPSTRVPTGTTFIRADYGEFVKAALGRSPGGMLNAVLDTPFDAVILGWGSLSHVLDRDLRARIFAAAARVAPRGPILASFWCRPVGDEAVRSRLRERVIGLGTVLGRLRGIEADASQDYVFSTAHGFGVYLGMDELARVAADLGRSLHTDVHPFPRVVLAPSVARGSRP